MAALKQIIKKQRAAGSTIPKDINNHYVYNWNDKGRLSGIVWRGQRLKGTISFSKFPALEKLYIERNKITGLDIRKNKKLRELNCSSNKLTGLDINLNPNLKELYCIDNKLTNLDMGSNTMLEIVDCSNNKLAGLNTNHNLNLKELYCTDNKFGYRQQYHAGASEMCKKFLN